MYTECKTLKHVVASVNEAETGGMSHNCQKIIHLREMLMSLDHPQPATPVKTDNSEAASFVKDTLKKNRSKSRDVYYHCIVDQISQDHFYVYELW